MFHSHIDKGKYKYICGNFKQLHPVTVNFIASNLFCQRLRYRFPKDRILNCLILNISVLLRKTTRTISDSIEKGSPVESKIVNSYNGNNRDNTI